MFYRKFHAVFISYICDFLRGRFDNEKILNIAKDEYEAFAKDGRIILKLVRM